MSFWSELKRRNVFKVGAAYTVLAWLFISGAHSQEIPAADIFVPSKVIRADPPTYPSRDARKSREGWVLVSFIINEEGDVESSMIEDSSGPNSFEKAAIRAVKRFKFEPATLNGEPVISSSINYRMIFVLPDITGVTEEFSNEYREIAELLSNNLFEEAERRLVNFRFGDKHSLQENKWYWWLDSLYAKNTGDTIRQLESLERIFLSSIGNLPPDEEVQLFKELFLLRVGRNLLTDALSALDIFSESENSAKSVNYESVLASLEAYRPNLERFIQGDQPLTIEAVISDHRYWHHSLSRYIVSVSNVNGLIGEAEIRCADYHVLLFSLETDEVLSIPESWKNCSLYIKGETNTTFTINELSAL